MDWWNAITDGASNAFDTTVNKASEWYGGYLGDFTSEPAPTQAATNTAGVPVSVSLDSGSAFSGVNWAMVGGIVAVLGLLLAFTRGK